ncbi:PH domain-containing protein [Gracilibacillus caseinilyticus]|uniref:PH domain-containing protein n=1 Tax=Gracilibacillus caseinilyticus TaxID=2932256 RepID=A0ABY4F0F4_9BACI|nr:PH domain-containing protein [Gracilibacillus caseinilyticus]UOQ49670.1 PH domain-containing protein [Gracilibacillus caseinilyticus]
MEHLALENKLSPAFFKARLISESIGNVIGFIILIGLFWMKGYFNWPEWADWLVIGAFVIHCIGTFWSFIEPKFLYQSWGYQLDREFLQISHGVLKKEWVTVPMTKVQSVTTSQGPIMKAYQLRGIKVETMGSSHSIPALDEQVALELRERLAEYAKLKDVEE